MCVLRYHNLKFSNPKPNPSTFSDKKTQTFSLAGLYSYNQYSESVWKQLSLAFMDPTQQWKNTKYWGATTRNFDALWLKPLFWGNWGEFWIITKVGHFMGRQNSNIGKKTLLDDLPGGRGGELMKDQILRFDIQKSQPQNWGWVSPRANIGKVDLTTKTGRCKLYYEFLAYWLSQPRRTAPSPFRALGPWGAQILQKDNSFFCLHS